MFGSPFSAILPRECAIIQPPLQAENHAAKPLKNGMAAAHKLLR
jgi:hypothetical protein